MDTEKRILNKFHKACADYGLLADGDKILIAVSGGKDSLELVRLFGKQIKIYKPKIQVEAAHVIMDNIPYETSRTYLQTFCKEQNIPLHILHSHFDESTDKRKTKCFLCSWNRRKTLFTFAKENGFNKVALGHHMDDFLTTLLLNMTFEGNFEALAPILPMRHYPISIIRPLCLVKENDIQQIATVLGFEKQKVSCPYEQKTHRHTMKQLLKELEQLNPEVRYSLWHALKL